MQYKEESMTLYKSVFFIVDTKFYMRLFNNPRTPDKFNEECKILGSHNFLENYYYKKLVSHKDELLIEETDENQLFDNQNINLFSGVEYLALFLY